MYGKIMIRVIGLYCGTALFLCGDHMDELKSLGLNKNQINFMMGLAAGELREVAYKKAYPKASDRTANTNATRLRNKLLEKPGVQEWLDKHYASREQKNPVLLTIDQRKEILAKMILHGKPAEKLKALDIYNKMEAVYERRTKVEGDVALTIDWAGEEDG